MKLFDSCALSFVFIDEISRPGFESSILSEQITFEMQVMIIINLDLHLHLAYNHLDHISGPNKLII